jgi:hypothetical protein
MLVAVELTVGHRRGHGPDLQAWSVEDIGNLRGERRGPQLLLPCMDPGRCLQAHPGGIQNASFRIAGRVCRAHNTVNSVHVKVLMPHAPWEYSREWGWCHCHQMRAATAKDRLPVLKRKTRAEEMGVDLGVFECPAVAQPLVAFTICLASNFCNCCDRQRTAHAATS